MNELAIAWQAILRLDKRSDSIATPFLAGYVILALVLGHVPGVNLVAQELRNAPSDESPGAEPSLRSLQWLNSAVADLPVSGAYWTPAGHHVVDEELLGQLRQINLSRTVGISPVLRVFISCREFRRGA